MKRFLQISALLAAVLSLNSCGLPMAVGRTIGRTVEGATNMLAGGGI